MHDHENEQVCVCLEGQLTVATETDEVILEVMTLELCDIISAGTPRAHVIRPDDEVRAEVDRFGSVRADVVVA